MKFTGLKAALEAGVAPVYLFEGEDAWFRDRGVALIKDKVLSEPQLNYASFEGSSIKGPGVSAFVSSLVSLPFLSERRVVYVREWYPAAADLKHKALSAYFASPEPLTVLAISNEKKCEPLKKMKAVEVVDCGKGDPALLARWAAGELRRNGLAISGENAAKIAEYCLSDMTRIDSEVRKLALYAQGKGEVTAGDIDLLVVKDSEYKVYEMTEHIASGRFGEAHSVMRELIDKNENKQRMFVAVYSHFRRMLHVSLSTEPDGALAAKLGVKEYAVKMTRRQAAKFPKKALKRAVDRLTELDTAFKTGKLSLDSALFLGVFELMVEEK